MAAREAACDSNEVSQGPAELVAVLFGGAAAANHSVNVYVTPRIRIAAYRGVKWK